MKTSILTEAYIQNFMEQSPCWGASTSTAIQEISRILWNPKVHYRIHKSTTPLPILSHTDPVHVSHPTSVISIWILSSYLSLGFQWSPSFSFSSSKTLCTSSLPPYLLYAQPISVFLIWSLEGYLLRSTEHKAPRYVVFSIRSYLPRPA